MSNKLSSINFAHISPTEYLSDYTITNGAHLLLAHLVETDEAYASYYRHLNDGKMKILDNSGFEMFKQGRPMYPSDKLIEMGQKCNADIIVMSDYPGEHVDKTIRAAEVMGPELLAEGFGAFFVPQCEEGKLDQLLTGIEWAMDQEHIDLIGMSILACPIAFGVEKNNRLQRFLSRWSVFNKLSDMGILDRPDAIKRFHCLGMVDGPQEIKLLQEFFPYIYSWDSSAAVWAGLNGLSFDGSPTGLLNGKFEKEVDFDFRVVVSEHNDRIVARNIYTIDRLAKGESA